MRAIDRVRLLFSAVLVSSGVLLAACAQPQAQQSATSATAVREPGPDAAATAERVAELAQQLESVTRYAAQMEEIYAAQEAEILALRQQVASLASRNRASE